MALKLASGSYDNTIKFWDPSTGSSSPAETIKLSSAPNRIEITEDKSKIVIGMNNCAKVYDLKRADQHLRSYESDFKGNVTSVGCFWKQENVVYTGCEDGYLRLFDIRARNSFRSFKHDRPINCTALHPSEGSIVTGDEAGIVKWWDLSNGKEMMKIEVDYSIRSITISETL